jgi:hypothetical protein
MSFLPGAGDAKGSAGPEPLSLPFCLDGVGTGALLGAGVTGFSFRFGSKDWACDSLPEEAPGVPFGCDGPGVPSSTAMAELEDPPCFF